MVYHWFFEFRFKVSLISAFAGKQATQIENIMSLQTLDQGCQPLLIKVVVQPAASADLARVVFSLSNPNGSSHVTGQKCTLQFLQIINCSFLTQNLLKTINKKIQFFPRFNQQKNQKPQIKSKQKTQLLKQKS